MAYRKSNLPVYPSVDLIAHAKAALGGAEYHLVRVREQVLTWQRTPDSYKANANTLHWHLRAFFWELVAAMETMKLVLRKKAQKSIKTPELDELERAERSKWFEEVQEWRNFAHRALLFVQGEFHPDGRLNFLFLPPLARGESQHIVPDRLQHYFDQMRELQGHLLKS